MYLDPRVHPEKTNILNSKNGALYIGDVSPFPFPIFSFKKPFVFGAGFAVGKAGKPGLLPLLLPLPPESHRSDLQMSDLRSLEVLWLGFC